ncbi:MAG: Response regulator receiver domain protein [Parcubacteria group bacterium GW2011_GWC2_42_6]|nr:MAG: Response regulator receiver domain protein [Parcubacteria group bacterium GW2011_GWC2_42_6]
MENEIKVLIIEDDKFLRDLLSKKLEKVGFSVDTADDGLSGFKKAQTGWPNIILLDLVLPGVDGFEAVSLLKKDPITNKIAIIILSNLNQQEDIDKIKAMGVSDYLIKALHTPDEIVEKIKAVYHKKDG